MPEKTCKSKLLVLQPHPDFLILTRESNNNLLFSDIGARSRVVPPSVSAEVRKQTCSLLCFLFKVCCKMAVRRFTFIDIILEYRAMEEQIV
jgi:hypothetical protein